MLNETTETFIQEISSITTIANISIYLGLINEQKTTMVCIITAPDGKKYSKYVLSRAHLIYKSTERLIRRSITSWKLVSMDKFATYRKIIPPTTLNGVLINELNSEIDTQKIIEEIQERNKDTYEPKNALVETTEKLEGYDDVFLCFSHAHGELYPIDISLSEFKNSYKRRLYTVTSHFHLACGVIDRNIMKLYITKIQISQKEDAYKERRIVEELEHNVNIMKITGSGPIRLAPLFMFTTSGKLTLQYFMDIISQPFFIKSYAKALLSIAERIEKGKKLYKDKYVASDWKYITEEDTYLKKTLMKYTDMPIDKIDHQI
jgi:hypothetical protein